MPTSRHRSSHKQRLINRNNKLTKPKPSGLVELKTALSAALEPAQLAAFKRALKLCDPAAAWEVIESAHPACGPRIVMDYYLAGLTGDALRDPLTLVWATNHKAFRATAKYNGVRPASVFKAAAFDIPAGLPETLPVWRGVHGIGLEAARSGESWTDNRDIAILYAVQGDNPLVIRRQIHRSWIVSAGPTRWSLSGLDVEMSIDYASVHGLEIIFDAPDAGDVCGDEFDWYPRASMLHRQLTDSYKAACQAWRLAGQ